MKPQIALFEETESCRVYDEETGAVVRNAAVLE